MNEEVRVRCAGLLSPSKEQKERMFSRIEEGLRPKQAAGTRKKRGRKLRTVFAAAAAVCVLTAATAAAAEYLGLDLGFLRFLKPAEETAGYLAQGAYPVNRTDSNENGTLTVKQVLGGSDLLYILLDFTAPPGESLDYARYQFESSEFDTGLGGTSSWKFDTIETEEKGDTTISLVMSVLSEQIPTDGTVYLKLGGLQGAGPFPGAFETIVPGTWEVSFPLDIRENVRGQSADLPVTMFGYAARLKTVSLSPVSVALKLESASAREISEAGSGGMGRELAPNVHEDAFPVTVHYADGTAETTGIFRGLCQIEFRTGEIWIVKTFPAAIDDRQVRSIEFFGVEVAVSQ